MKRRYEYDDEMDEMDEGACGEYEEGDDEDGMEESVRHRRGGRRTIRESRSQRRQPATSLREHNELLTRANNRSGRYLVAYSALVNSGLSEAQMIDVIQRLDDPNKFTLSEFEGYVAEAISAYERGDRRPGIFESSQHRPTRSMSALYESADLPVSHDPTVNSTLSALRRMNQRRQQG